METIHPMNPCWEAVLKKDLQETFALAEQNAKEGKAPYMPPKQILQYLVRMGSFTSVPALQEDIQDVDFEVGPHVTRESLLTRCKSELPSDPALLRRNFVFFKPRENKTEEEFTTIEDRHSHSCHNVGHHHQWQVGGGLSPIHQQKKGVLSANPHSHPWSYLGPDHQLHSLASNLPKPSSPSGPDTFRILTWNILAQALAVEHDNFVGLPQGTLHWTDRRLRILHEIIFYNPDVICLQEVDHFNFINKCLLPLGYRGVFCSKPDSPCIYLKNNNGPDGCALFYRKDKFDLLSASSRVLEIWRVQSNQVCILAQLKIKATGQQVCVATTHLKARQGALLATMRNEQGKDVSNYLAMSGGMSKPLVLCGDFNAVPSEAVVSTIKSRLAVESAYSKLYNEEDAPYTTWKVRGDGEYCHTLDYIFYNKFFDVKSLLLLPTEQQVGETRLPNLSYASDHIAIACDLQVKA